jgi:ribosomal protein S21
MKYEETLKRLQKESEEQGIFKPLKLTYPTESPRGQPIERKHFKILASNVPIVWNNQL